MPAPSVYVLVINWNGLDELEACFDSLLASTYPEAHFVLVDNGSTDGSLAFTEARYGEEAQVEILALDRNYGWSGGNNRGIDYAIQAGADYIFLLNNDTAVEPDGIAQLVASMEQHPERAALAPKMVFFDSPWIINSVGLEMSLAGAAWDKGIGRFDTPQWNTEEPVIGVCGGACFLRAAALAKTTLLPEEFGIYLDDLDLSLQLWDAGYEIWSCPQAVVRHKFSASTVTPAAERRKYYRNTRNRYWLILRNIPWKYMLRVKLAVVFGEIRAIGRAVLDGHYWILWVHGRAWGAGPAYMLRALRERRQRKLLGQQMGRWWQWVLRTPLFCPGVERPDRGWYGEVSIAGKSYRAMSPKAIADLPAGEVTIEMNHLYPDGDPYEVAILQGEHEVAVLSDNTATVVTFTHPGGALTFKARQVFTADAHATLSDYGGWVRITQKDENNHIKQETNE